MWRLFTGLLVLGPSAAAIEALQAADRGPEPPIEIEADQSDYDLRSGISRFSGNVVIIRGDMVIHARRATIYQAEGRIDRVELEGNPSTWRDVLEDGSALEGEALRIEFDVPANVITLTGSARIRHAQGEFSGHELIYDLDAESLAGRAEGEGRVRVIIEPGALEADRPGPADEPAPPAEDKARQEIEDETGDEALEDNRPGQPDPAGGEDSEQAGEN